MRAYSVDLRERVLTAVDGNMPRQEVAATFGVSLATIKRLLTQRRDTGTLTPKTSPGRPPKIRPEQRAALWAQLEAYPDVTLATHCHLWEQAHGVQLSTRAMARAIKRLGWTRKKRRWVPPSVMSSSAPRTASASPGGMSMPSW
jgi:transposase